MVDTTGAAQERDLPDGRQAAARGDQGAQPLSEEARSVAAAILPAPRQARGDDGGTLRSCQAVQAQQTAVAHPAHAAGPARARHSPQDRGQREYRGGVCVAADARQPYPLAAAAPARLEAVFLPCPEVECIGKGNVRTPYEFGVKVSIVTTNARAPKFRSRTMFPTRARSNASEMLLHIRSLAGYATDTHEPSFWK
jgi:hypothetical protein